MSGICGIVTFDGVPVPRAAVDSMCAGAAHRGSNGTFVHRDGSVGLGYLAMEMRHFELGEVLMGRARRPYLLRSVRGESSRKALTPILSDSSDSTRR